LNRDITFHAAIHGVETKAENEVKPKSKPMKLTRDQEKAFDIALKKAQERKRMQFARKQ